MVPIAFSFISVSLCLRERTLSSSKVLHWLRRCISALQAILPTLIREQKLERFLIKLALTRYVAASTQNQTFNAIAFFYKDLLNSLLQNVDTLRAALPARLRHSPILSETRGLVQTVLGVAGHASNHRG